MHSEVFRRDRRGRSRRPGQERGLRPLFPLLETGWQSRALRVAMPVGLWSRFDEFVACFPASTRARSHGEAIAHLLNCAQGEASRWLDWEQEKHSRLLDRSGARTPVSAASN